MEGYTGLGREQFNKAESVEEFEKLKIVYRPSMDPTSTLGGYSTKGSEEFPWEKTASVPALQNVIEECFSARLILARKLLSVIALALDLPEKYFESKNARPTGGLVLKYYPAPVHREQDRTRKPRLTHGLQPHLWQDQIGGLQILSSEGQWINA